MDENRQDFMIGIFYAYSFSSHKVNRLMGMQYILAPITTDHYDKVTTKSKWRTFSGESARNLLITWLSGALWLAGSYHVVVLSSQGHFFSCSHTVRRK